MEAKKISFGFMKTKKPGKIVINDKKEYIDCVEEKNIKIVGGEVIEEKAPLVIPMKPNSLGNPERMQQIAEEVEKVMNSEVIETPPADNSLQEVPKNETLDQMAERELLQQSVKDVKVHTSELVLPISVPTLTGEKESTMDDYESVPIADFGMAMLRGMGWKPNDEHNKYKQPSLRPKGLGLGADKVINKTKTKSNNKEEGNELMIIKDGFVKVNNGKYNGYYGKVLSIDEDTGRAVVELVMKKETVSLGEFMMQPVTKTEFDQQSRVLNADKYEQYKKSELTNTTIGPTSSKHNRESSSKLKSHDDKNRFNDNARKENKNRHDTDRYDKNGKISESSRRRRSRSDDKIHRRAEDIDRNRKEDRRKYSSNDSLSSHSESDRHRNGSKIKKHSRHSRSSEIRSPRREKKYSSSESLSNSDKKHKDHKRRDDSVSDNSSSGSYSHKKSKRSKSKKNKNCSPAKEKKDIDKKRKGKKKKRDRDRSPNYRKYRK